MNTSASGNPPPEHSRRLRLSSPIGWGVALACAIVASVMLLRSWGKTARAAAGNEVVVPQVVVARVDREDLYKQISVPAEFRPYMEVDLHAKVSGYVQRINVDIGDQVKEGELLAVLEIPELKDELDHAIAAQQRAEAEYKDAHLAYTRLVAVNKEHPNLVAQQDLDTAEAKDATALGALAGAKADVEQYQTLVSYTRITAPFAGVVTKRYADPGSLIQAGTASQTQAMPLVRLSDNTRLRLDFPISVDDIQDIHVGDPISVKVESLGGRALAGKIARVTDKVDDSTRTMITEVEVDNHSLELVPGMYATVILKVQQRPHALAIPVQAVSAGGRSVLLVDTSHKVIDRPVTLGLETPAKYEVRAGLEEGDLVMIGNPEQVGVGQRVDPRITDPVARQ